MGWQRGERVQVTRLRELFVKRVQRLLLKWRRVESNPRPLRDTGNEAFHKIDNVLGARGLGSRFTVH